MQNRFPPRLVVPALIFCLSSCAISGNTTTSVLSSSGSESVAPGFSSTDSSSAGTSSSSADSSSASSSSSSSESEVIFTYKNPTTSEVLEITAKDFFGAHYPDGVASASFDRAYEILIRNHFEKSASIAKYREWAQIDVQDIKGQAFKNAATNKTDYEKELSKLLADSGCEDVTEFYEARLTAYAKEAFEKEYETDETIEKIRDGNGIFTASDKYGAGLDGYLVEKMPYALSHILIRFGSMSNGEYTQAAISESESRKLGWVIEMLAGADWMNPAETARYRANFSEIAYQSSEDQGSAGQYGKLSVMDLDEAFIDEFKFGIYSFESIYNAFNQSERLNPYAARATFHKNSGEAYKLTDKIRFSPGATYADKSQNQTIEEAAAGLPEGEHYIRNYFKTVGASIGTIPYGAAVALAKDEVAKNDFTYDDNGTVKRMDWQVNEGSVAFYPRNILFNKYFNNHHVAVIIPNEIPYNDHSISELGTIGDYTTENFAGKYSQAYAALPGFQVDTSDILPNLGCNALTTEKGQIVLAIRGGSPGVYEGIHFTVIDRSALHEFVELDDAGALAVRDAAYYEASKDAKNITSLSEFYTIYRPNETNFPTYRSGNGVYDKTTYINQLRASSTHYASETKYLKDKFTSYNVSKDTHFFQNLIEEENVVFANNETAKSVDEQIRSWITSKRNKSKTDSRESFDEAWAAYIEHLVAQNVARFLNPDGSQRLISETCAIGYNEKSSNPSNPSALWSAGGACSLR